MELQLAIDLLNKESAAELANKVKDYVDIVEIGTPIIYDEDFTQLNIWQTTLVIEKYLSGPENLWMQLI